jgi:hypothetical protein
MASVDVGFGPKHEFDLRRAEIPHFVFDTPVR